MLWLPLIKQLVCLKWNGSLWKALNPIKHTWPFFLVSIILAIEPNGIDNVETSSSFTSDGKPRMWRTRDSGKEFDDVLSNLACNMITNNNNSKNKRLSTQLNLFCLKDDTFILYLKFPENKWKNTSVVTVINFLPDGKVKIVLTVLQDIG